MQQLGFNWMDFLEIQQGACVFSCWITKATTKQSEHVILITVPPQQWLAERPSTRRYMHIACLVTYKERNGYWFYVCRFYMNCTALRHTCDSNVFVSCTETKVAQSLQLLSYVMYNRGLRVLFRLCNRLFYTMCRPVLWSTEPPTQLVQRALFEGKAVGTRSILLYHLMPSCKQYGAIPTLHHIAWCLIEDRIRYCCLPIK